jgi:hypothetical protein
MLHDGVVANVQACNSAIVLVVDMSASVFRDLRQSEVVVTFRGVVRTNLHTCHTPETIVATEVFVPTDVALELLFLCDRNEYFVACDGLEYIIRSRIAT